MNNIKRIRKMKNLTLEKLSLLTGKSIGYLSHLEIGSRDNPSFETMNAISKALDSSVAEIFFAGNDTKANIRGSNDGGKARVQIQ